MTTPKIGAAVHYFDPKIITKIGYTDGYGRRGIGPYHAVVINDEGPGLHLQLFLPDVGHLQSKDVLHKDAEGRKADAPYWDWTDAMARARAARA